MANTIRWLPGPTQVPEYDSLDALRDSISSNYFAAMKVAAFGIGEVGTPPWYAGGGTWGYAYNSGMPYLACAYLDDPQVNTVEMRWRYDAALTGMLDPGAWFPGIFVGMGQCSQADWNSVTLEGATRIPTLMCSALLTAVVSAQLCRGTFTNTYTGLRTYFYGGRAGQPWGLEVVGSYNPTQAERERPTNPIVNTQWSGIILSNGFDDGTLNIIEGTGELGSVVKGYPQPIATGATGQASWNALGDGVNLIPPELGNVKDSIDNLWTKVADQMPSFDESCLKQVKSFELDDKESVTHPDDQALDPYTPVVASPRATAFAASGAVTDIALTGGSALLRISKPALVKVASLACTGAAGAAAWASGFFPAMKSFAQLWIDALADKAVELVDWVTSAGSYPEQACTSVRDLAEWFQGPGNPPVRQADATERQAQASEDALAIAERIAVALERIADEVCRDPEDPLTHPGIINVIELASQARSDVTLRANGWMCTASTGVAVEDPNP